MLKSILIIDSGDEIYNELFLFDDEKKFQEAKELTDKYEKVLDMEEDVPEEFCDEETMWFDTRDKLVELSVKHYTGMPEEENEFDFTITR